MPEYPADADANHTAGVGPLTVPGVGPGRRGHDGGGETTADFVGTHLDLGTDPEGYMLLSVLYRFD